MGIFSSEQSFLGIDLGDSSIKIVELAKSGNDIRLLSYGFSENSGSKYKNYWQEEPRRAAYVINKVCDEAGVKSRNAISALPTYSVFSSVLNLANVPEKEIDSAVHWEAKKVIPLPLDEMILDWRKIEGGNVSGKSAKNIKILLTGAPKTLVKKYINIFKEARVSLLSLETETFSLIRSLVGNDKSVIMLVELGASTTDICIIDKGIPMLNRSIDVGGTTITKALSNNLNVDLEKAEQFKYDLGITSLDSQENVVPKTIIETVNPVINEIKYSINLYQNKNNTKVEKIILSGGAALLMNFSNYLSKLLDINVIIGDPWARISYPEELKPVLSEIGPRISVAVGLALREIE